MMNPLSSGGKNGQAVKILFQSQFQSTIPGAPVNIQVKAVNLLTADFLPYDHKASFAKLCREGCPDYNRSWSCPPHSPDFRSEAAGRPQTLLVVYFADLGQFTRIPAEQRIRQANTIMRLNMEKHLHGLEKIHQGRTLDGGICRYCAVCTCADQSGPCRWPQNMRCSMESLGLDVAAIAKDYLDFSLAWGTAADLPSHISAIGCLMTEKTVAAEHLAYHF